MTTMSPGLSVGTRHWWIADANPALFQLGSKLFQR